jgi:hypothetical protein
MVVRFKGLAMREFGVLLWELISRPPQAKHGEVSHSVLFLESMMHVFVHTINCSIVGHLIQERIIVSRNLF